MFCATCGDKMKWITCKELLGSPFLRDVYACTNPECSQHNKEVAWHE